MYHLLYYVKNIFAIYSIAFINYFAIFSFEEEK